MAAWKPKLLPLYCPVRIVTVVLVLDVTAAFQMLVMSVAPENVQEMVVGGVYPAIATLAVNPPYHELDTVYVTALH